MKKYYLSILLSALSCLATAQTFQPNSVKFTCPDGDQIDTSKKIYVSVGERPGGFGECFWRNPEVSKDLRDKLVVLSNGTLLVNENYKIDADVLDRITFFKNIVKDDGSWYTTQDLIKYVSAEEIRGYYDDNQKLTFIANTNIIQKKVIELISIAYAEKATDIHIVLQAPSTHIYFRVLGDLKLYKIYTFDDGNQWLTTIYNSMTATSGTNYNPREQQDANMGGEFLPEGLSGIRIATGPTQAGNNFMVLRLLPTGHNTKIADLGYAKSHLRALRYCKAAHNGGLTLFCGPTGSGKSTTMQAFAKETLMESKGTINFLTIEDPVEYPITVDDYIEVIEEIEEDVDGEKITREFLKTIKVTYSARQIAIPSVEDHEIKRELFRKTVVAAMRQDPDKIMIGEIRDSSTADAAITASNTGHPVISSVHARNSLMIVDRLITIGADENLLLSPGMINGLIAQHLVPELCPKCKRLLKDHLNEFDQDFIERLETAYQNYGGLENIYVAGAGCDYYDKETNKSCIFGKIGRFVIAEIIIPDETFLQLMRDKRLLDAGIYWTDKLKGYTMMCHGMAKVKWGLLDPRDLEGKLKHITPQANLDIALLDR